MSQNHSAAPHAHRQPLCSHSVTLLTYRRETASRNTFNEQKIKDWDCDCLFYYPTVKDIYLCKRNISDRRCEHSLKEQKIKPRFKDLTRAHARSQIHTPVTATCPLPWAMLFWSVLVETNITAHTFLPIFITSISLLYFYFLLFFYVSSITWFSDFLMLKHWNINYITL